MTTTVLDLFAGTRGFSQAFHDADVYAVELDPQFDADLYADLSAVHEVIPHIEAWLDGRRLDLLLASPPCNSFSTGTMGRMWTKDGLPKHPTAVLGQLLVLSTLHYIARLRPRAFAIENPRARLGSLPLLAGIPSVVMWQCHLGKPNAKPTQIWYGGDLELESDICHNRRPGHGETCCCTDHNAAPRGSVTGTQGTDSVDAAALPFALSQRIKDGLR